MILLDTHVWVRWLVPGAPLPSTLVDQIEQTEYLFVSAIFCWEVTLLEQRGKLSLPLPISEWIEEATTGSQVGVIPVSGHIAVAAAQLPEHHRDPADRLIISSALEHDLTLASLDSVFPRYEALNDRLIGFP